VHSSCPQCKRGGAVNGGICVKCAHKNLRKEIRKRKPTIKQEVVMSSEKSTEFIKHTFTEEEKREIASEMAQKITEANEIERQAKAVAGSFKGQIDELKAKVSNCSTKYNNGFEMRNELCDVSRDYDNRMVYYYLEGTSELVKERAMTASELQRELELR
jgi:hypothetical protein